MAIEVQEPPTRVPAAVAAIGALAIGVVWLALFVIHLVSGAAADSFDTWLPLLAGAAFVLLGIDRLRRSRR